MGIKEDAMPDDMREFDEQGGIGYDPRKEPSLECPECFGEGTGEVFLQDTRTLSPEARSLYAGVKRTKEGIEVMMHSKQNATQLLMRHLGMLNDKVKLQGDPENPVEVNMKTRVVVVPSKNAAEVGTTSLSDWQGRDGETPA